MTGVVFGSDGSQQRTIAALETLAEKSAVPTPVLEESRTILAEGEAEAFASSGSSLGDAWAPLADSTVAIKGDSRILVMTGTMRAALSNPENVHVVGDEARLDARVVPYAHFHVTGTSRMPARPFLGISSTTQRELMALMSRYMTPAK